MSEHPYGRVMSDHIAWCKSERSKAHAVTNLLTTHGARFQVHEFAGALRDVTAQTVAQNRSLVEHLDAFLTSCELGEDEIAPVFATKQAKGPTMSGRDCEFSHQRWLKSRSLLKPDEPLRGV